MRTTSKPRILRAALAVAAGLLLTIGAVGAAFADDMGVEIRDGSFFQADTTLHPVGAAVHWHNAGTQSHSVKFADGVESPVLAPGDDYKRTFTAAGDYPYTCGVHPEMTGIVHVITMEEATPSDGGAGGNVAPQTDTVSDTAPGTPGGGSMLALVALAIGSAVLGTWLVRRRLTAS